MPLLSHSLPPDNPADQQGGDFKPDTKNPAR